MSLKIETPRIADWLLMEQQRNYSRGLRTVLSGQTLKAGQVCFTDAAGKRKAIAAKGSETHTYTFTGTPTAGYFKMTLWHKDGYWVQTAAIAYNASQATVDAAIEAVLGTSTVVTTVTGGGSAITVIAIAYSGTGYATTVWPLGTVDRSNVAGWTAVAVARSTAGGYTNETQRVTVAGTISGGTFKLGIPRLDGSYVFTDTIAWNATWATVLTNIQAALDNALGTNIVVATDVSGSDWATGFDLAFSGTGYAGWPFPPVQVDTAALTGATTSAVTRLSSWPDSISLADVDASGGDVTNKVFLERHASVNGDALYWGGCDPVFGAKCLEKVGILVRSEPSVQERF